MKILVLIDKFKNSLSSITLSKIIKSTLTNHEVDYFPISDGGDGFLDSINFNKQFKRKYLYVKNALNEKCKVYYLIKESTQAAALDALDLTNYRLNADFRIVEDKFVENLTRRFAENVTIGDYTIIVEDINEMPPKVSLRVRSGII